MNPSLIVAVREHLSTRIFQKQRLDWHIRHLEHYLSFYSWPQCLEPDATTAYLNRQSDKPEWQVDQMRTAIEALYHCSDRSLPPGLWQSAPDLELDCGPLPEDEHERLLVQHIRARQYMLTTERTYLRCWRKLSKFSKGTPTIQHVQAYLTYLSTQANVAPNTQKIYLNAFVCAWKAIFNMQLP